MATPLEQLDVVEHNEEAGKAIRLQRSRARQESRGAIVVLVCCMGLVLGFPQYFPSPFDNIVMGVGAAASFTLFFFLNRESLRSRRGSLIPAICLVAAMWLFAAVTTVISLID
ncbi:MAG: hypothetical protein HN742_29775 [Lentisphaerae bacterium]|jgi:hypothetical protein|nr:hypothetical protein [Lentisphaerota bacterium]MBT7061789.1 hypothetical protein [Lentisphaerota bacterium]MBT7846098.1 hypothetical protein [Lentisphaerota bacterium]